MILLRRTIPAYPVGAAGTVLRALLLNEAGELRLSDAAAAPTSHCPRDRLRELAPHVIEAASAVSAAL